MLGGLAIAHEAQQGLEAALGGGRARGIVRLVPGRVEHGGEVLRPAQRKIHIGESAAAQAIERVRGKIDYCELSTPLLTLHFANYHQGQIYGPAGTPERFRARALSPRTPIRNLYLTGADAAVLGVAGASSKR